MQELTLLSANIVGAVGPVWLTCPLGPSLRTSLLVRVPRCAVSSAAAASCCWTPLGPARRCRPPPPPPCAAPSAWRAAPRGWATPWGGPPANWPPASARGRTAWAAGRARSPAWPPRPWRAWRGRPTCSRPPPGSCTPGEGAAQGHSGETDGRRHHVHGEQIPENRCRPPENLCIHHEGR
jgi:hypothetical protein